MKIAKQLFTVFRAENGFYAQLPDGSIIVALELSECCTAVCAALADRIVRKDVSLAELVESEDEDEEWSR